MTRREIAGRKERKGIEERGRETGQSGEIKGRKERHRNEGKEEGPILNDCLLTLQNNFNSMVWNFSYRRRFCSYASEEKIYI